MRHSGKGDNRVPETQRLRGQADYRKPETAGIEWQRRKALRNMRSGVWVVGMFEEIEGNICLLAVNAAAGSFMPEHELTSGVWRFYRWRTRQGANQWLRAHDSYLPEGCSAISLGTLPGLPVECLTTQLRERGGGAA